MSAAPPPFQPQAIHPPSRGGAGKACLWIAIIVVGACVALGVAGYFFTMNMMRQVSPLASCTQTFEAAQKALVEYAAANGGKLPEADTWMDDVQPYYEKHIEDFSSAPGFVKDMAPSPPGSAWGCQWDARTTGLTFNTDLGGAVLADIKDPAATPMVYESEGAARNKNQPYGKGPSGDPPKVFGNKRKWMLYYVEGEEDMDLGSSTTVKVEAGGAKVEVK
jgi:hypothetical protein